MRRKRNSINFNLGSSSLLLIFVVLSLVSFAVLSLSTALSDKNMAQKNLDRNIAYYDACNIAQDYLISIDDEFYKIYNECEDSDEYTKKCLASVADINLGEISSADDSTLSFVIPVSSYQGLQVVVEPTYSGKNLYSINSWKLVYTTQPNIDFSVDVIK